jgi:site-specific DNA-methyltransferase (adenine-specific)
MDADKVLERLMEDSPQLRAEFEDNFKLKDDPRNSRTHSDVQIAQLVNAMREWGFTNPVLIDETDTVIAGHARRQAAIAAQIAEIPTITLSGLTPAQRRALVIADNQLAANAGWNMDILREELQALGEIGFDTSLLGFSDDLLATFMAPEGKTDPDQTPDPPAVPASVLGDVWVMGKHRVMCGDAVDLPAVEKLMGGVGADVLITDPPYNVAYEGKTKQKLKIQNDAMEGAEFRQFLRDAFVSADAVMKPGAVFYVWHADSEGFNFRSACADAGWKVRQCLIWAKDSMVMSRQDYHWQHEPCLYGWKGGAAHLWAADRKQTTILRFDRPSRSEEHPTMKPVALVEYQMMNNTKGADVVLDLFGGSGTTLIAAEKAGRYARLMELDPRYVDVIVTRWQDFSGQTATLEQCLAWAGKDAMRAVEIVLDCNPNTDFTPHQLAAFADIAYNVGPRPVCDRKNSTMARLLEQNRALDACYEFPKWNKARLAGVLTPFPGLTKRREANKAQCLTGVA